MRYTVLGWVEVPYQAIKSRRYKLFAECTAAECAYIFTVHSVYTTAPCFCTWVFIVPFIISSFALMFGNWSQHIFINPENPTSNYALAYNCVACVDNLKTFNDGYHIVHHANSQMHWSEMPQKMVDTLDEHAKNDAFVFVGIGFFDVGAAVFLRRYRFLLRHFSRYSEKFVNMEEEELIDVLKNRLKPLTFDVSGRLN